MTSYVDVLIRLLLAAFLGGVVGIERESLNRPAGLRTHVLVCVGSALIMIVSLDMYNLYSGTAQADPGRIAAQVVSGIGFLGAGTILRDGMTIRGLTTAASLWAIAGIGLATGLGLFIPAAMASAIILLTLVLLSRLERVYLQSRRTQTLYLTIKDRPGQLGRIGTALGDNRVNVTTMSMHTALEPGVLQVELNIVLPHGMTPQTVSEILLHVEGVEQIEHAGMH